MTPQLTRAATWPTARSVQFEPTVAVRGPHHRNLASNASGVRWRDSARGVKTPPGAI
jgi:hypothetical protein